MFMGGQSGEVGAAPFCLAKQNKTTTPPRDGGVSEPPTMPEKVGEDPAPPPARFNLSFSTVSTKPLLKCGQPHLRLGDE